MLKGPLKVVVVYATFAALWILFSDRAVAMVFKDPEQALLVGTLKGWLFVLVTSILLFGLINRVMERPKPLGEGIPSASAWWWRGLTYVFSIVITLGTLALRLSMQTPFTSRPLMILFMFPIIISAFIGGLGPGLVATGVAGLGVDYFLFPPIHSFAIAEPFDIVQWGFLLANGVLVSLLSEVFHRSRNQVEANWRLQTVTLESIGDGVITTDMAGQITFLNPVAERLTGWSLREATGLPLQKVFHIVQESTGEPADDPVSRVIESGQTVGLSNHTLLIARNGERFPILDSASPIRLKKGPILGIVLAFRDDSDRRIFLKAQEEKIRALGLLDAIASASPDVIFAKDLRGRYLLYNKEAARIAGKREEDVLGRDDRYLFPAEEAERLMACNRRVIEEERSHTEEMILTTVRGPRAFLATMQPLRDPEGRIVGVSGISRDITERNRADQAMREREASYRSLFENIMNTVARCRMIFKDGIPVDYEFLEVNPAFEKVMNLHDVTGKKISEVLPGYCRENQDSLEIFGRVARTGEPTRWEHHLRLVDKWFSYSIYSPASGEFVVVSDNITERKKAELALRESEESLERAQAIAHVGSWRLDIATGTIIWSEETYRIFGLPVGEPMTADRFFSLIHPDDRQTVREAWHRALSGQTYDIEHRIEAGQRIKWVREKAELRRDEAGRPVLGFGSVQDITERKASDVEKSRLQAEFLQAQKLESIGRLAGGVAHDFNNMLQVIAGNAELALNRVKPADPLHAEITLIKTAAERSADLTRQLLAFARRQTISPKVLNLNDAVSSMVKMLSRLVSEDIKLVLAPKVGLWKTRIDPAQLDQVLANLTVNARDAIEGIGTISLQTDNEMMTEADCLGVLGAKPGAYVTLSISDSGCGMAQEVLDHIFEPFFTTKESGKGTGLGLATVFGIAQQNGGFVLVSSRIGAGSVFKVYFPRFVEESPGAAPEAVSKPKRGRGETVLMVEDEETLLFVGEAMLKELGYTVIAVGSPELAIQRLEETEARIDLFLVDVVMPGMNGRELAKHLARLRPEVPILFMSGYTADVIADRGTMEEGLHLIPKPFTLQDLSMRIRELLKPV